MPTRTTEQRTGDGEPEGNSPQPESWAIQIYLHANYLKHPKIDISQNVKFP